MHGLVNIAIQRFAITTYGEAAWDSVMAQADLGFSRFEAMLHYAPGDTTRVLDRLAAHLDKPRETVLEDLGTFLVSDPTTQGLRRLLRFGGVAFVDFLHSLDDLPDRARLAVSDLDLPGMALRDHTPGSFSLTCSGDLPGFGHVMLGVLRAMADDYGALVLLEHRNGAGQAEVIEITLVEDAFSEGRAFALGGSGGAA